MIAVPPQPSGRAQRRWLITVLLVFIVQLGLIFCLSDKTRPRARPSAAAPMLRLRASGSTELLDLMDPTWFALPHRQGFSGPGGIHEVKQLGGTRSSQSQHWCGSGRSRAGASLV